MAQQNIDFGAFPDDPDADAIRAAFQKTQQNFTDLYTAAAQAGVTSLTVGAGLAQSRTTGNVVISANISNISLTTSSLRMGVGSNTGTSATAINSLTPIVIDIGPNVNTSNVNATNVSTTNLTVTANANITGNLTLTGNVGASRFISTIATGTAPLTVTSTTQVANLNVAQAGIAGTVTANAQPNITSVGTLTGLTVGNAIANTIFGNGTITSASHANVGSLNVVGTSNLGPIGNVTITGGSSGYYLQTNGSGGLTWAAVSAGTLISNGTSNVNIPTINSNVNISVGGTANVLAITATGANILGTLNASGNANVGNIGATNGVFTNVSGNGALLTGLNASNLDSGTVPSARLSGSYSIAVSSATTAGTVTTAAQPNITSVGTLSTLSVTGNVSGGNLTTGGVVSAIGNVSGGNLTTGGVVSATGNVSGGNIITGGVVSATGNVSGGNIITGGIVSSGSLSISGTSNLGPVSNVTITGGTSGQYLQTNGSGSLSWASISISGISNGNSSINIPVANGNVNVSAVGNDVVTVTGTGVNVTGTITTTANVTAPYFIGNIVGNISGNIVVPGTNTSVLFNNDGNAGASANFQFNKDTSNAIITGNLRVTLASNLGNSVASNYFIGNGSLLASLTGANVTGTVANATYAVSTGSATNAAALTTTLTSTGTAYIPFISATANGNYAHLSNANFSANLANGYITATGFVGTLSGSATSATTAGTVTTNAQPNITSVGTLNGLTTVTNSMNSSVPVYFVQTWNNSAVSFNAVKVNVLDTASNTNSTLLELAVGGVTKAQVTKDGNIFAPWFTGNTLGANVTGTVANATYAVSAGTAGTVTIAAQPNITSVGTLTSLGVNGTITAVAFTANTGVFTGNGSGLSAIAGANVTGTVANATYAVSAGTAGTVTIAAQPNITSLGTVTGLTIGNATANSVFGNGTITLNNGLITGNGSGLSQLAGANVTGTVANATYAVSAGSAGTAGTVTIAAQPNITSVGTLTGLTIGNATANSVFGNGTITLNNGLITGNGSGLSQLAGANVTGQVANALIAGTVYTDAQPNITSVGTLTSLDVNGTVTAVAFTANTGVFTGNGAGLSHLVGSNVTGQVANALIAGTVTTNAQPNITSIGTLSGLTVSNATGVVNFTTTANVSLGSVSNLHISGGTANYVLKTDGAGNLSWTASGGITITDDTTTGSNIYYPTLATVTTGALTEANVSSTKLYFNPFTGQLNATNFNSLSDRNKKSNIAVISDALTKVNQLNGVTYNIIPSDDRSAGLIAQDVQMVLAEAVKYNEDHDTLSLNYNGVVGLLVEAVKTLSTRVTELENKLNQGTNT